MRHRKSARRLSQTRPAPVLERNNTLFPLSRHRRRLQPDGQAVCARRPYQRGSPMEAQAFIRNSEGWNSYFWRKWIPTGNLDGYWGEYTRTPYEFPLIRLGDVLLMLAEAYNEQGFPEKAVAEVNKVRARVSMPDIPTGSHDEIAARIRKERACELAGEGQRYWDLRRWGMLEASVKRCHRHIRRPDVYTHLPATPRTVANTARRTRPQPQPHPEPGLVTQSALMAELR